MKALCTRWPLAAIMAAAVFAAVPSGQGLAAGTAQDPVRKEAEALAQAASQEFGSILDRQRVAQASSGGAPERPEPKGAADQPGGAWNWLQRSRQQFQALMQLLAGGRPQPTSPADQPAPNTAATAGAAVMASPTERTGEPSPRAGAAVSATPETKTADGKGKDKAARPAPGAAPGPVAKQNAETKTAQTDTKPDAAKKPDTPKSDAPKSDGKAAAPKAGEPKTDAPKAAAPKSEPGKADTKTTAPKAGEPSGAAQGKPPAKAEGTAGTPPPAGAPAATVETAPGGIADAPMVKTAKRTRRHAAAATRRRTATRTCRAAGRAIRAPGWYVVRKGDTLSAIARRHYGSGRLYTRIRAANRGRIRSPERIYACQRIYLPRIGRRR